MAQIDPRLGTQALRLAVIGLGPSEQAALRQLIAEQARDWRLDCYSSADQAFNGMRSAPPDVLMLDICREGFPDIDCTRKVKLAFPKVAIVIVTGCPEPYATVLALMAGARGYLVKPVAPPQLLRAVSEAARGWPVLCWEAQTTLLDFLEHAGRSIESRRLTPRECQVAACLVRRLSDKQIGAALGVETGTVHVHLANVFRKLSSHRRGEAAAKFLQLAMEPRPLAPN